LAPKNSNPVAEPHSSPNAPILGRKANRFLFWGVPHVPKILVTGQSNGYF